jgi:tetratricopeptide (TPR) repeat protein
MKLIKSRAFILAVLISICGEAIFPVNGACQRCEQWAAKIVSVQGVVEARKAGKTEWVQVKLNDAYCPGDMIRVKEYSRASIFLANEALIRLDQNTTITITGFDKEETFLIEVVRGVLHLFSRFPKKLKVITPFVNATVEGTEFYLRVELDQTFLSIFEGKVAATNELGTLMLAGGQSAVVEAGKAPMGRVVARPRDAVHWALYYPPVKLFAPGEIPRKDHGDPRFLAYRASQLLAVGRVDEAGVDIQRALSLDPKYSDAFALQTIIFVVQNEREKALGAAQKAVETGPNSATARIAKSYAQQAHFDLEGALASVEEAIKLDSNNALAWARLAELWSSFGRLGRALNAAQKAVELNPNLARTQMVLGFAYLTQIKTEESRVAFEKAIELDQADPLSRLGLGLTKIRDGDLDAGGQEIEIAASLDPNNSLVRSYLGKVYFEKKKIGLDEREYAIAKKLDPNDPTPWFYDAIAKQTTNRPVEALHNMQKAIELNDNRAVYRSSLMLDSDLAARSASRARIYSDLGFQQRALFEGWMSVNTDPSNFSAHRFLADSLSVLPRHEVARVSHLLKSQLLQPINITPIQPRLGESNQFLLRSVGAADLSFNEFNPLFNRNRVAAQGSGLLAENDTYAGEGVVSGIYNNFSLSAGYTHFETDGWRENADLDDEIASIFGQLELTYKTSIQAEYRYRDNDRGDTQLRFFKDDFLPNLLQEDNTKTARVGFRHAFSPGSTLIGNFQYADVDRGLEDEDDLVPSFKIDLDGDDDAYGSELSYLFRSHYVNLVTGGGYFYIDSQDDITLSLDFGVPPLILDQSTFDRDVDHTNVYLYSYISLPADVKLTVGVSYDDFNADTLETPDENQFNPKFGITWNPIPNTTLRAAAFRTLTRTLISNQTIEPTQIAGFNQFFDELVAIDAWRYGGAIDQKFSESIYGGVEYTYRNLSVPYIDFTSPDFEPELRDTKWEENILRAYLFWTPHNWLSLTAEYLYEDFDRDPDFAFDARDVKTHYVPLGINFFHPSGLSAGLKGTYMDQDGEFERQGNLGTFEDGNDSFWLVDAAIKYRLPKRHGFITIGVANLFDEDFEYFDTEAKLSPTSYNPTLIIPRIQPDRSAFLKLTLAF